MRGFPVRSIIRSRPPATFLGIFVSVGMVVAIGYYITHSTNRLASDEPGVAAAADIGASRRDENFRRPEELVDENRNVVLLMTPEERVVVEALLTAFVQAEVDPGIQVIVFDDTGHRGIQEAQKFATIPISGPFEHEHGYGYMATDRPELLVDALFDEFQVQNATNVAVPPDLAIGRPVIVEKADLAYQRLPLMPPGSREPITMTLLGFSRPAILPDRCLLFVTLHSGPLSGGGSFLLGQLVDGKWILVRAIVYGFS